MRAEGLSKIFPGDVVALEGVSFSAARGELVALIGANGSGKTTLLHILFGILAADHGEVELLGLRPRVATRALRSRIGFAGQDVALDPETTGWETLRLFYALRGLPHRDRGPRLARLAEAYGLSDFCARRIATYSGGQRRRLHLALAVMHDPPLLLLDEPTTGLDPEGRAAFWRLAAGWREAGCTLLVATHDLDAVAAHCDRALILALGRLLADAPPPALIADHGRARGVINLAEASPPPDAGPDLVRELGELPGVLEVGVDGRVVTLWRDRHPEEAEPALSLLAERGVRLVAYERHEPDLASAYFRLTGAAWTPPDAPARPRRRRRS